MKKLGFGFMRLPLCDADDYRSVDGEQVKKMVDQFMSHGFTAIADVQIQDENGSMALPVAGGTNLTENYVGAAFSDYDSYLVLSHFKGHAMAGFGGAIKNISTGLASGEGKCWIHTGGESLTSFMGGTREAFTESMAEAGKSVSDYLGNGERITYINVMNRLSIDCDCNATPAEPDLHDIGILASNDPVALDQACIDFDYSGYGQKEFLPMKKFLLFLLACALLLSATACASAQAAASSEDIAGLSDRSSSGGASEEPSAAQAESALSGAEEPLPDHGW